MIEDVENTLVKRSNGDGEIRPLSSLLFCKDCGAKMHIRIEYRNDCKRHIAYCSEYHKERGEWGAKQKKEYILEGTGI